MSVMPCVMKIAVDFQKTLRKEGSKNYNTVLLRFLQGSEKDRRADITHISALIDKEKTKKSVF